MNTYQSNIYRKDLNWLHFDDEPRVQESRGPTVLHTCLCSLFNIFIQEVIGSTSPDMTTVFHGKPYGRFIEIKRNHRRKKVIE